MRVAAENPDQPEVIQLIAELDAYQDSLYPPESRYALDLHALMQPNVVFAVARDGSGTALGCGAIVFKHGHGELKRMFVAQAFRGKGVADRILDFLEAAAQGAACPVVKLETGPLQPQALAFYTRSGYEHCGRFGDYKEDPFSVFMQKHLPLGAPTRRA